MSLFVLKPVILIFDDLLLYMFSTGIYRCYCSCVFFPFSENYMVRWVKAPHCHRLKTGGAPWISKEILRKLPYGARELRDAELMITMDGEWLHMLGISQPYPCLQPLPMYGQENLEEMVCWMYMDYMDWIGDIGNTKVHFSQMMRGTIVWMCLKSHSQKGGSFLHLWHQASKNRNVS